MDTVAIKPSDRSRQGNDLRVLLVEDTPGDERMVLWALRHMPRRIVHRRVASESELREALEAFSPDVILSDFEMPGFGGHEALRMASQITPLVPFLFVSGTIGEEVAIEALRRGAADYVLKENLRRLPSAIERALKDAREHAEHVRMQRALAESEIRFRAIVETSHDWIWEADCTARLTYSNGSVMRILGYPREELLDTDVSRLLVEEEVQGVEMRLREAVATRSGWQNWRLRWRHRDGSLRVLESTGMPMFDDEGQVYGFRGIARDVTGQLRHETKIRNLARIHAMLGNIGSAVMYARSREDLFQQACRTAVEQGGFKVAGIGELRSDGALHVVATHGDPQVLAVVAPKEPMPIEQTGPYGHHPGIRAFREKRRQALQDFATSDIEPELRQHMLEHGVRSQISLPIGVEPWGLLALYSDDVLAYDDEEVALLQRVVDEIDYAADFIAKGERLEYLAYHNPLTGLPNGVYLREQLSALARGGAVAVAAIEAPQLGRIAATRGKAFADALLGALGARLGRPGELIAQTETYTLVLAYPATADIEREGDALELRLSVVEQQPLLVDDEQIHLVLRSGLALVEIGDGSDGEHWQSNAMTALADAHRLHRRVCTYSAGMRIAAVRMIELERDLRRAVDNAEFQLHYQPKFDADSGRLKGAEALLRWRPPGASPVPPSEFIPVLEETGLIVRVGHWVTRQALATALEWRERFDPDFRIAVNVSAREMRDRTFMETRRAMLGSWPGNQPIDVEVTESLLMENIEQCIPLLQGLREMGCEVAIDDFGTGYSSLNYLARLPVDVIKIDRSFISELHKDHTAVALTTNIINLAQALGLRLVAEGVEAEGQARVLRRLRCDVLQGYLFGQPLPKTEFESRFFARKA